MKDNFVIDSRVISESSDPLIIAEIGINHNGNLKIAKKMVDAAYKAGAEIVKHQTHVVEDEMTDHAKKILPGNSNSSIFNIMKSCSLSIKDEIKLKKYIESKGMIFLSTPFSRQAFYELEKMKVKAYKVGSGECNNYPLLELIAKTRKPTILSTGMNNIESVKKAVNIFKKNKSSIALLHTTNLYPTPDNLVRLGGMQELMKEFPEHFVGLSDHTLDSVSSYSAIALGAKIIERHFTDTRKRSGPDIICSMNPAELKELIKNSKRINSFLGGKKEITNEEGVTSRFAFASVVADINIKKGEALSEKNLWVRRPGTGHFLAKDYEKLIGKIAKCDIEKGEQINPNHI
tara:strand:+ start:1136 stop:2173 length:1038 start_codon:yes stop_codon:yes gene_type:complete